MIALATGVTAAISGVAAAASGWTSPTGLAAFITAIVGAAAFIWSIVQGFRKRREIDVEAAAQLIEAMRKQEHE